MKAVLAGLAVAGVIAAAVGGYVYVLGAGGITVQDARIVASPDNPRDAKLFMTLANRADEADRLIGVATDLAWGCGFHGPTAAGGSTPYIELPAESIVRLGPGGAYIDLSDLGEPIKAGDEAILTLVFERAGEVPIKAHVADTVAAGDGHAAKLYHPAEDGEPVPSLEVAREVLADGRVALTLTVTHFEFDKAAADGEHARGTGHAHLYIDGEKIGRIYGADHVTPALAPGRHRIEVILNTNDHRAYAAGDQPIAAAFDVVVE